MNTRTKKSKKNITRKCYNRGNNNLALVDTHLHLQPFDGRPIPFKKMVNILHNSGILYAEGEGIGQRII